ncbi:MAG: 1-acyl-sn-glycerol-3-phosphate acyltransferase [Sandaracinaceae bacterium]
MTPGDLEAVDAATIERVAPWLGRVIRGWFRTSVEGLEHLPSRPFVGVGNHSGAAMLPDTLSWLDVYYRRGNRPPLVTLAHDAMFDVYPGWLSGRLSQLGAVRADPSLASLALQRGFAVQCYPGGDHDACRPFWRRNRIEFAGRTGYVRLARQAGVPIVPVVSVGAHEALLVLWDGAPLARWLGAPTSMRLATFPVTVSVPWGLFVGPLPGYLPLPTKVSLRVLPPLDPEAGSVDEVDRRVRGCMQAAADAMAEERRFPVIG